MVYKTEKIRKQKLNISLLYKSKRYRDVRKHKNGRKALFEKSGIIKVF